MGRNLRAARFPPLARTRPMAPMPIQWLQSVPSPQTGSYM